MALSFFLEGGWDGVGGCENFFENVNVPKMTSKITCGSIFLGVRGQHDFRKSCQAL